MSDLMSVTVTETPIYVSIDSGTHSITITDLENPMGTTTVAADTSSVVVVDERPIVNIFPGSGSVLNQSLIVETLNNALDLSQFVPELADDLQLVKDLWIRVGRDVEQVLIDADTSSIINTATTYTDTQIQTVAIDIQRVDGDIAANTSAITQTADSINLRVTNLEQSTDGDFTAQSARIDLNASDISSQVTRVDTILTEDQTSGIIVTMQSDIVQEANRITLEISNREALENGAVATNTSNITQTAASLVTVIETNDQLIGRADSAEVRLTATEQVTSILSESLGEVQYSLQTTQAITANSYGVTIEETVGGIPYVAGFELILHPAWALGSGGFEFLYAVGDVVSYTDTFVYRCILEHYSSVDNSPGSAAWATYWELVAESAQTEFNIQADHFSVITPGGLVPMFDVDGGTGEVTVNADLIISGSLESANYGTPGESYYKLDHTTGSAEFNNITMSFTSSTEQDAFMLASGVTSEINQLQSQIDGNITSWFLSGVPTLLNLPASDWTTDALKDAHLGDLYYDDLTGYAYRFQVVATVYSWTQLSDSDIQAALQVANDAQDTADGKRRVFVVEPTGPYDIGDLWDSGNGIYRANTDRTTGYLVSEWTLIGDLTAASEFVTVTYPADITTLEGLIEDGKLDTWYVSADPSATWSGTDASHTGDMWWNTSTNKLKRWGGAAWSADIEDQLAIDAYADAATAQDTADGKRRVFVVEPTGPYDIGDLWDNSGSVYRATADRVSGYLVTEWTKIGDVTSTTNMQIAIDASGALILASRIADHATTPTLDIDFSTAEINVSGANGLQINSGGGMAVNSGGDITINDGGNLTVDSGGDIIMNSDVSDESAIRFLDSDDSAFASIFVATESQYGRSFHLSGPGSVLVAVNWDEAVIGSTDNTEMRAGVWVGNDNTGRVRTTRSGTHTLAIMSAKGTSAQPESYVVVSQDTTTASLRAIELNNNGTHIHKMLYGFEIYTGLTTMGDTTAYDYLIPNVGDFYYYNFTGGVLRIRQRRNTGYISRYAMS